MRNRELPQLRVPPLVVQEEGGLELDASLGPYAAAWSLAGGRAFKAPSGRRTPAEVIWEAGRKGQLRWLWGSLTEDRENVEGQDVLAVVDALRPQGLLLDAPTESAQLVASKPC